MSVWTQEMKSAAMADAQKVCDLTKRVCELETEVIRLEGLLHDAALRLAREAETFKEAALAANRVSDPRQK